MFEIVPDPRVPIQIPTRATLFVGDLSYFCNEAHLMTLFSPYGRILNIELKRGKFGDSLMHAFLDFDQGESARRSIQELHGIKFMGRIMRVNWASGQVAKEGLRPREQWSQVHVAFSTPHLGIVVTEEVLEDIFSRFGALADITVKRHSRTVEPPCHTGYAFLYFFERRAAMDASQAFAIPSTLQGLQLQCNLTSKPPSSANHRSQPSQLFGQANNSTVRPSQTAWQPSSSPSTDSGLFMLHPQMQPHQALTAPSHSLLSSQSRNLVSGHQSPQWSPFTSTAPSIGSSPALTGHAGFPSSSGMSTSSAMTSLLSDSLSGDRFGNSESDEKEVHDSSFNRGTIHLETDWQGSLSRSGSYSVASPAWAETRCAPNHAARALLSSSPMSFVFPGR